MMSEKRSQIEAVTFDLDDTLVQYERSPAEVLRTSFEILEVEPLFSVEEYYARYDEFARKCNSMEALRSECFAALAAENGYERQLGRDVANTFSNERDQSNVELLPSADRVLDEFSRRYQVAIITNGARDAQQRKIGAVDLEQWTDTAVVAGRNLLPKPNSEPFERAMESLDVSPSTTVHVGDSLETDIAGATAAGLDSVWISPDDDRQGFDPTYRVASIGDLLQPPWTADSVSDTR
ncbi:HAD family hydrolase [Natrinema sp. 74]|uniref:HAD family hydrolase n=1 Tax=Natrinema sp. 74 TaxID=3384159 RepID=UPI0038D4C2B8